MLVGTKPRLMANAQVKCGGCARNSLGYWCSVGLFEYHWEVVFVRMDDDGHLASENPFRMRKSIHLLR